MLQAPGGASLEELSSTFGWRKHTTRAALTGLRKKGYAIVRSQRDGGNVYRIEL
jgi:DNA-binding IclR family transcriptional regulator